MLRALHRPSPASISRKFARTAFVALLARLVLARVCGAIPVYDHIVVVVEENHSQQDVIGDRVDAPYMNSLADRGVSFTHFHGLTHPSQPSYLEIFSGYNQGINGNSRPANYPFSTPNLGAELFAAGRTFTGYSEDLPATGDADTEESYPYARRHNPWANWQDATVPTPPNRLPPSSNLPFSAFPSDFSTLPTVAFVVPNVENDMHDGSIMMADDWLRTNIGPYADWAQTHNSLLIIIWDEDSFASGNRIPAIFFGAGIAPQINSATWTNHNLLRTIEDICGTAHAGAANNVRPVTGIWPGDLPLVTVRFQQGVGGYGGTHDTMIRSDAPGVAFASTSLLTVVIDDGTAPGNQPVQSLIRFDNIFGNAPGCIPEGAPIVSAKLLLQTGPSSDDRTLTRVALHPMFMPWGETWTWEDFGGGVSANDGMAASAPVFTGFPTVANAPAIFDVTSSVQSWATGVENFGWALIGAGVDRWRFYSAEALNAAAHPILEVTFCASQFEFSAASYGVVENAGVATITVMRRGMAATEASVDFSTSAMTATAGLDYTETSGTLHWAARDSTPRTFTVPIAHDATAEGIETIALTLSNPTGIAALTERSRAVLSITETPIDAWRVVHFGADALLPRAGDLADPDGDGVVNLLEYAAGTDPLDASSFSRPYALPGALPTLSFQRAQAPVDVTCTVQVSPDLANWFDGSSYAGAANISANAFTTEISRAGTPVETIVVRANAAAPRYLRLKVTRP